MALASLTIDLIANLSRFEGDMGRAAQIATRDGERMARAAQQVERALQKQADQVGRTQAEYLALKAAEAGLGDGIQKYIEIVALGGAATTTANAASVASYRLVGDAGVSAAERQKAANAELVRSIQQINAAALEQKRGLIASNQSGGISDERLKVGLQELSAKRLQSLETLKLASAQQQAAAAAADAEKARASAQAEAARKIVDAQNGITASYRAQLAALRELRDAGALSPAQFRQAGIELVNRNPALQQRAAEADAAKKSAEAQRLAAQTVVDSLAGIGPAYRKNLAALQETFKAGELSAAQFQAALARLNDQRPDVQRYKAQQQEIQAASEAAAAAETASSDKRRAAATALIEKLEGVGAQYRKNLVLLQESLNAGDITPKQFQTSLTQLNKAQNPNVLRYQEEQAAAQQAADRITAAAEQKSAAEARSAAAFAASIKFEAETIGKTRAEILALKAAQQGLTQELGPSIAKIAAADEALLKYGRHAGQAAGQVGLNTNQLLTLKYTISDVVASLGSGISPFTILTQQGGQLAQIEGGISGIFRGLVSYINPFTVGVTAAATAVAGLAYAWYEGEQQGKRFGDALVLSGNFAGQTAGKFTAATREIGAAGQVSISAARDYGEALIATGQIGPVVFKPAIEAAARYGAATGKNAKEVAADFASMGEDVAKWATEHNKQLNFVTQAQIAHIQKLQEQGQGVQAQAEVYELLNARFRGMEQNLGTLDRVLRGVTNVWHEFWDAAFDIGRPKTIEEKIADAQRLAAAARNFAERDAKGQVDNTQRVEVGGGTNPAGTVRFRPGAGSNATENAANVANAEENVRLLKRSKASTEELAAATAELARLNKDVGADTSIIQGFQRQAKAAAGLTRELDAMNARFARQDELAKKDPTFRQSRDFTTAADRATILAKIRENYTDKPAASQADQTRKSILDQDIKAIQARFAREKEALQFSQQELQALYNSGAVSLADYYERKRANIADGVQKELRELGDEQARLQQELDKGKFKDPHEKIDVQTKLNAVVADSARVAREAAQATKIANIDEGESFRQLGLRISEFRASLLQLGGDEEAAARVRAQNALSNLRKEQTQSGGAPGGGITDAEVATFEERTKAANAFAEVQRRVSEASATAARNEEIFLLRADREGLGLRDSEQQLYVIRSASLVQLGELRDKAQALADASTDPKVKAYAADLAVAYAKAADSVDAGINRLREAVRSLSGELASTIGSGIANFAELYSARALAAAQDVATQKQEYNQRINVLEGYLAQAANKTARARLLEQIKALEAQRDATRESGNLFLKTVERDILGPLSKQVVAAITKVGITEPLEKTIKGFLDKGLASAGLENVSGPASAAAAAASAEAQARGVNTSAISDATRALQAFSEAAGSASAAMANSQKITVDTTGQGVDVAGHGYSPAKDSQKASEELIASQSDLTLANAEQASSAAASALSFRQATGAIGVLASGARYASEALRLIQSVAAAASASGSAGGFGALFGSLFGGGEGSGGATAGASSADLEALFGAVGYGHSGGIAGSLGERRTVNMSVFAGATRYHLGGIVGLAPDEVPAILRQKEEVLRRDDPRHRYNTGQAERTGGFSYAPTFNVPPNTDHRTLNQISQAAYEGAQRAYQRNS